jgi:hypothetical protein
LLLINLSHVTQAAVQVEVAVDQVTPFGKPQECQVAPGQSGTITYDADVIVRRWAPSYGQVFVNFEPLYAENDIKGGDPWGGSVIPPTIAFQYRTGRLIDTYNVTVSVTAPPMELMSAKRNVTINGDWFLSPGVMTGEVIPYTFPVAVKHYYLFVIRPIDEYKKVWPSEPAKFKLGIVNQGNSEDVFYIEVDPEDKQNLEDYGYVVEIKQSTIKVAPRSTGIFEFKVYGPQRNIHLWKNQISMIPIRISTPEAPAGEGMVRIWQVAYYEVGIYIPDPCLILIVVGIIVLIILILLRRRGRLRRRRRKSKKK